MVGRLEVNMHFISLWTACTHLAYSNDLLWCWSIILINQLMDWSIDWLIDQSTARLINIFKKLFFHFFFKKFKIFKFEQNISSSRTLYSSRTLGMLTKYCLSIEGSILSWWKGDVDGALDPWSCFYLYASDIEKVISVKLQKYFPTVFCFKLLVPCVQFVHIRAGWKGVNLRNSLSSSGFYM